MNNDTPTEQDMGLLPTLLDIVQQLSGRLNPPIVDVTLTVTKFRDLLAPGMRGSPATAHTISLGPVHPNVELIGPPSRPTIRVSHDGATLRFNIIDQQDVAIYNCVAVTFARTDSVEPRAIYFNTGHQTGAYTPFTALKLNGPVFQFTNTIIPGHQQAILVSQTAQPGASHVTAMKAAMTRAAANAPATAPGAAAAKPAGAKQWMTYKFSVILQRQSDGAIGIIDPPIENEGDPQGDYMLDIN